MPDIVLYPIFSKYFINLLKLFVCIFSFLYLYEIKMDE